MRHTTETYHLDNRQTTQRIVSCVHTVHTAQQSSMKSIGSLDLEEVYRRIVDVVVGYFCATAAIAAANGGGGGGVVRRQAWQPNRL